MSTSFQVMPAVVADAAAIAVLVNSAYRGEGSKKGWTTEADLLGGQRTDQASIEQMIHAPQTTILKYMDATGAITGCVYLHCKKEKLYLGMLTVSPELQTRGIGKLLLKAAEKHASDNCCTAVTMTVISVRQELIAWYERHGYIPTGEKKPFPEDPAFGLPKQELEFIVMEKEIGAGRGSAFE
jgi:ribosomal protein S18 acetylase RimI-like enzyme